MKKIQRIDSLRNIQKKLISYLSVCIIVMLGIGGFSTALLENNGIRNGALDFYEKVNDNINSTENYFKNIKFPESKLHEDVGTTYKLNW